MADLEQIQTILAFYSIAMQTMEFWRNTRNRSETFALATRSALRPPIDRNDPRLAEQARRVSSSVPQDVADLIERRFQHCWTKYVKTIDPGNEQPDNDVDNAEREFIKCACREARRLFDLTGGDIPSELLKDFWDKHNCEKLRDA